MELGEGLAPYLSALSVRQLPVIKNLFALVTAAAEAAGVYILSRGCIEHYYTQSAVRYMPVPAKDRLFHAELEHLLNSGRKTVQRDYAPLIAILEKACAR